MKKILPFVIGVLISFLLTGQTVNYHQAINHRLDFSAHKYSKFQPFIAKPDQWLKSANTYKQKLDSIIYFDYNETTAKWDINNSISKYGYDSKGKNLSETYMTWNASTSKWVYDKYQGTIEYTYDLKGSMLSSLTKNWDENSGKLVPYEKVEYTYDSNNNLTKELISRWNTTSSKYDFYETNAYTYDSNNNRTVILSQYWNQSTSKWINHQKWEQSFNSNSQVRLWIQYSWNEITEKWDYSSKSELTSNADGKEIQAVGYNWKTDWVTSWKEEYTYDSNGNPKVLVGYYRGNNDTDLVFEFKDEFSFDAYGNLILVIENSWNRTTSVWELYLKVEYTYNHSVAVSEIIFPLNYSIDDEFWCNKMPVSTTSFLYKNGSWVPANEWTGAKEVYYYSGITITGAKEISLGKPVKVYPNPANETISFEWIGGSLHSNLYIYNSNGLLIFKKQISNGFSVSVEGLSKGMYFYKLTDDCNRVNTGKICVE